MPQLWPKKNSEDGWHADLNEALTLPVPDGQRSVQVLQPPHDQDEVYIVARGKGWFVNGSHRHRFASGDALFVPAGVPHRFEEFRDELVIWVIFYGPQGGEAALE